MTGFLLSIILINAPHIEVSERSYDFGYCLEGESYRHTFWIYNTGDEPLNLGKVRTFCGCSATNLEKTKLNPGDSTSFDFTYDTRGFFGNCVKWAYIPSNALNDSLLMFNVTVKLFGGYDLIPFEVDPEYLLFEKAGTPPSEIVLKLKNTSETTYNLNLLEVPEVLGEVELSKPVISAGEEIVIKLHPLPGFPDSTMYKTSMNFEAWIPTEVIRFSVPIHLRR
ncbi:DUF1573 domain-containing protein [candidate division WOR-3 bacterium]|uniref:DUF1573 domain-containing protein n=1 Tax=candidate division WOR-3 bacterium TaxID=2052148 RepID=A0A9D5QDY0_UNCW3|nr:DUF1573 domain-containing protein [candidate division WOR-3 bacterium]MBD3364515.1 DUF1573 domain-containing protein [candidate division WOR-3 bacterium]